jgi:uroporphyrin-III C-methyltransferase
MHKSNFESTQGRVTLVGAGPGDPDLLTVKAVRALQNAQVVVHDGLVDPRVLDLVPEDAERIDVSKKRSKHTLPQEQINSLLVTLAHSGHHVVRLKGGDPFIFGRGGEEVATIRAAGIAVEVIPGVSSALGCAAEALLPLTHRDHASAVTFVAGQCKGLSDQNWQGLAGKGRTLAIYMGLASAQDIANKLIADGLAETMPVAVLERGTLPGSRAFRSELRYLAQLVEREAIKSPALIVVGEVTRLANATEWLAQMAAQAENLG